jgi:hypothetical protein
MSLFNFELNKLFCICMRSHRPYVVPIYSSVNNIHFLPIFDKVLQSCKNQNKSLTKVSEYTSRI